MAEADRRPLQASDLDQAAPNHLVKVVSNSGHITYVNSLVLDKAGITPLTSNPPNGVIVKDRETGAPTGELQNASAAINALVPRPGVEDLARRAEALGYEMVDVQKALAA